MRDPCTHDGCPRAATHANGGCWEHAEGTDLRPGAECEHGQLARKCDRCEDAQEIARLRAALAQSVKRANDLDTSLSARVSTMHGHVTTLLDALFPETAAAWPVLGFDEAVRQGVERARQRVAYQVALHVALDALSRHHEGHEGDEESGEHDPKCRQCETEAAIAHIESALGDD